jgi:hypothetical protein
MPDPKFQPLDQDTFKQLLDRFPFHRKINAVHLHHTWRPNHSQYRGQETILAMWRVHTQQNHWSDIAQHVSIAPDGTIWTGRSWDKPPASATGFNGNADFGPFMIEMIGDFDRGHDRLEGKQREAALWVIACVQARFGLPEKSLRFHREMSTKTCPGTSVDYDEVIKELKEVRARLKDAAAAPGARAARPFDDRALAIQGILDEMQSGGARGIPEVAETELAESDTADFFGASVDAGDAAARGGDGEIDAQALSELAPYIVNLSQGRFSREGRARTSPGDVDRIFDEALEEEVRVARQEKRPVRLVFYAHGGLDSEAVGLQIAHKHIPWWRKNGVYPIYFIWETGLVETLRTFIPGAGQRGLAPRGVTDLSDRLIEGAIHKPGEKVWGGMKRSAERSVDPIPTVDGTPRPEDGGGATYVAQKLREFLQRHAGDGTQIELHAVGHSAGSIFHSYFVPTALGLEGVPAFTTTQFMAPAINTAGFFDRLEDPLTSGVTGPMTIYTMRKELELDDNCAVVYRKSLLYLIFYALEARRETPILGLEESLRGDPRLQRLFSPSGQGPGEVVWSESPLTTGRSASRSHKHGDFDDDVPTMDSIVRRVLDVSDTAEIHSYEEFKPRGASRTITDPWLAPSTEQDGLLALLQPILSGGPAGAATPLFSGGFDATDASGTAGRATGGTVSSGGGRQRALCVGIDRYPTAPLGGCVADARLWASTLRGLGFEDATLLLDEQATRAAILDSLKRMVSESRRGDVLVFQYAGHGTQLPDINGDEKEDAKDEAFCPYDFDSGKFLIDDDVREVFDTIPDGVNVTCFVDSCNSGSITRVAVGGPLGPPADPTARRRFLIATPQMIQAHREFRSRIGFSRGSARRDLRTMREVTFSACQPFEVAWEMQGQGEFTRRATRILSGGIQGLTNAGFQQQVEAAFGPTGRQRPFLDCADGAKALGLLRPLGGGQATAGAVPQPPGLTLAGLPAGTQAGVADLLRSIAALLSQGA